ncbi:MAG: MaoC/PaaZ C-terminal domain-containing protein [Chloroflexi bacterium]|nr:MaoC/PaaZ C-terminal domain-containing protein [Chloroflexota bacterium]
MSKQTYFEDVAEDSRLPVLAKEPTRRQLAMYAGASGDYNIFHYDQEAAKANGLPDVVVHGALKTAFLSQMLTEWAGKKGMILKLSIRYRQMDVPGSPMFCKGKVVRKYVEDGRNLVECEIWTENAPGDRTTTGTAIVQLPTR